MEAGHRFTCRLCLAERVDAIGSLVKIVTEFYATLTGSNQKHALVEELERGSTAKTLLGVRSDETAGFG